MREHLSKTFAIFGSIVILAMFINILNFIENQNVKEIETQIVSAFEG